MNLGNLLDGAAGQKGMGRRNIARDLSGQQVREIARVRAAEVSITEVISFLHIGYPKTRCPAEFLEQPGCGAARGRNREIGRSLKSAVAFDGLNRSSIGLPVNGRRLVTQKHVVKPDKQINQLKHVSKFSFRACSSQRLPPNILPSLIPGESFRGADIYYTWR